MSKQKREIKVQIEYGKSRCDLKKKSFLRPRCEIAVKNVKLNNWYCHKCLWSCFWHLVHFLQQNVTMIISRVQNLRVLFSKLPKYMSKPWSIIYRNVNSFEMFLMLHVRSRCIKSEVRCIQVSFYIKTGFRIKKDMKPFHIDCKLECPTLFKDVLSCLRLPYSILEHPNTVLERPILFQNVLIPFQNVLFCFRMF